MSIDARVIPLREANDEVLLAMARVEASLRVVLAAIIEMKREIGINQAISPSVPLKPDASWVGTP